MKINGLLVGHNGSLVYKIGIEVEHKWIVGWVKWISVGKNGLLIGLKSV